MQLDIMCVCVCLCMWMCLLLCSRTEHQINSKVISPDLIFKRKSITIKTLCSIECETEWPKWSWQWPMLSIRTLVSSLWLGLQVKSLHDMLVHDSEREKERMRIGHLSLVGQTTLFLSPVHKLYHHFEKPKLHCNFWSCSDISHILRHTMCFFPDSSLHLFHFYGYGELFYRQSERESFSSTSSFWIEWDRNVRTFCLVFDTDTIMDRALSERRNECDV